MTDRTPTTPTDGTAPKEYVQLPQKEQDIQENRYLTNITNGLDESIQKTMDWLETTEARDHFYNHNERITDFFETSGINDEWNEIITRHAEDGTDIAEEIYTLARLLNHDAAETFNYTSRERDILNKLADSSFELIKDVGEDMISSIRKQLIEDYANGVNPKQTSLKQLKLDSVHGISPLKRAETIARTETARIINTATLEQYIQDGVKYVQLSQASGCCNTCLEVSSEPIPIEEATRNVVMHPNCRCAWTPIVTPIEEIKPLK